MRIEDEQKAPAVAELLTLVLPGADCPRASAVSDLVAFARRHGVAGELLSYASRVNDAPLFDALTPSESLRRRRLLVKAAAVARVDAELTAAGVGHVFMKGLGLAAQTREIPQDRSTTDVDVLVEPSDLEFAIEALSQAGAYYATRYARIDGSLTSRAFKYLRPETTLILSAAPIDLHWKPGPDSSVYPDVSTAIASAEGVEVFGAKFPTLSQAHALWHASLHLRGTGYRSLRHLLDVAILDRTTAAAGAPGVAVKPILAVRALASDPGRLVSTSVPPGVSRRHWRWIREGLLSDPQPWGWRARRDAAVLILKRPTSLRMAAIAPAWVAIGPLARSTPTSRAP